jgi:hypothetical protein
MILKRIRPIRLEKLDQLSSFCLCEAGTDTDVLQIPRLIEETKQERSDRLSLTVLMPTKACNDTIAIALVFHLEHHSLIRHVSSRNGFSNYTIQSGSFETPKPIPCSRYVSGRWCDVQRRLDRAAK